jgi:hypothetical protein
LVYGLAAALGNRRTKTPHGPHYQTVSVAAVDLADVLQAVAKYLGIQPKRC